MKNVAGMVDRSKTLDFETAGLEDEVSKTLMLTGTSLHVMKFAHECRSHEKEI